MAIAAELRKGDTVESPIGFQGRITRIDNGTVFVDYADKGGRSEGIYTPEWFARWPTMLKKAWNPAIKGRRTG